MRIIQYLLGYYLWIITLFFMGRALLFSIYFEKIQETDSSLWLTFLYGVRMDTIVSSTFLVVPLILLTLFPRFLQSFVEQFLKYYFLIILSFLIYIENATFPFIAQYDVRPNYLFVEYLEYPKEVFGMIFAEYKLELLLSFTMIGSFIYLYITKVKFTLDEVFKSHYMKRVLLFIPLLLILFIGVRSSFGHRPANISDAMYSSNRTLNEITKNSLHSIVYAIYTNKVHGGDKLVKQYGKMPLEEAYTRVRKSLNIDSSTGNSPLSRMVKTHFKQKDSKNLVIFIQESLGYQFVEAVGGEKGITPNLNRFAKEGILFKDLYSNGTRSVRGLAGLTAGNYSIPGKGVIKRNKSQSDYFTIASLLKPYGYKSLFIYGGESRFDNMRGWYLGNGFDTIIDQPKFENPSFVGTWGVCDEEVTQRANGEFKKMYAEGQKFASIIFSTSNHSPFDFPDEKISLIDGVEKKSVKNAIKYADFSIGAFIDQARKEEYYKDTVFVVVADHNVRVYGADMVPVDMFHIPGIILGENIEPLVYKNITTQPDILATALDLLGLDLEYPIMGHSIFSDKKKAIALMQFHNSYALRKENKVSVIRPGKSPLTFLYKDKHLYSIKHDSELEKDALAFVIVLNDLYSKKLYK